LPLLDLEKFFYVASPSRNLVSLYSCVADFGEILRAKFSIISLPFSFFYHISDLMVVELHVLILVLLLQFDFPDFCAVSIHEIHVPSVLELAITADLF
jgi:hypothetical protein